MLAQVLVSNSNAARTLPNPPPPHPTSIDELRKGVAAMTPELFGRALRMARSPSIAEDLVQDTVERALRFEAQYRPGTNLKAWVHQILFSVFITKCRRGRRERKALDVLHADPNAWTTMPPVPEPGTLSPSTRRALDALPRVFRDAVVMVDIEELAYKDAAERLDVPVGTVMSRLHRGRRMLAKALGGEQEGALMVAEGAG
jgi:RNA polymerase sigma-70 factor, ECF subfamily